MIPLLLMLVRAPAMTPIDAERAFAADAQKIGQWTAFRKWSTDDAIMFVPQPANAHQFLKDRKDPPKAIDWWPTASYVSCDGTLAVNTGGWRRPGGSVGSFATVWTRRNNHWRWLMDKGDDRATALPRPAKLKIIRASCNGKAVIDIGGFVDVTLYRSADQTVFAGWDKDAKSFFMNRWTGRAYRYASSAEIIAR